MCKRIYKEQTSEQGDVPFFKIGTFGANPDAFISNELFEDFKCIYPYPTPGTLLISAAGSIGRVVEYQGEKAYFQDSNIVWLEHDHRLNDAFLKPLYSRIEWGLEGSTIKRLYNKDLLSAEVTVPGSREQKGIGQFFAKLDNLITLHQRKYDGCTLSPTFFRKVHTMQENITSESLFCDYYAQWVRTYKEGAIRDVTMGKYRLTQSWLSKLIPELRLADMDRTAYQQLINGYAQHHERQTTMDFHHQIKGAILDAVDEGLIPRDPTRKVIIKGKQPRIKKK